MSNILLRVVSQENVAEIFKGNSNVIFRIVEDALKKYLEGNVLFPDKISQIFDLESQNRINCMPATLLADNVCGVKWVSVFLKEFRT